MTIVILLYGIIMFVCGVCAGLLRQKYKEMRVSDFIEDTTSPDDEIACHNATVVYNQKTDEICWYDNTEKPFLMKE